MDNTRSQSSLAVGCLVAGCFVAGCVGDDSDAIDLSQGCDIRDSACQRAVYEEVAAMKNVGGAQPSVRTIGLAQFEDELREMLERPPQGQDQSAAWTAALRMVGLLSPRTTLNDATVADRLEQTAAFYDPQTKQVTVVDRGDSRDPLEGAFILAHEYVHALQDADIDLQGFREAWVESTDNQLAITCLIEGEATLVGADFVDTTSGPERALDWNAFVLNLGESVMASIEQSDEPFITAAHSLPYRLGTEKLQRHFRMGGAQALEPFFEVPPRSMLDWEEGSLGEPGQLGEALDCYPTSAPDGYEAVEHDTLGMVGLMSLEVTLGLRASSAWARAGDWRNDSLVVFQDPQAADAYAVAWRIRLSGAPEADALAGRLQDLPVSLTIVAEGAEVLIYAATDGSVADSWTGVTDCGSEAELPKDDDPAMEMMTATSTTPVAGHGRHKPSHHLPRPARTNSSSNR